ncbi:hypothetical protein [Microviridae sp.]|nr:hypothetical protein [Microviridae sp.]
MSKRRRRSRKKLHPQRKPTPSPVPKRARSKRARAIALAPQRRRLAQPKRKTPTFLKAPVASEQASPARAPSKASVAFERTTGTQRKRASVAAPELHPKDSPRAQCKEKPISNARRSGGSRNFIPWCGADHTTKNSKRR